MDAKPMDKKAEDRLLGAVKEAVAWVEDGVNPTEAIVKVAQELNFNPATTSLLAQAYNTGRTTFQREKCSGDVLSKMAEFPIVRTEDVIGQLWPSQPETPKQAAAPDDHVPECFFRPPSVTPRSETLLREKAAAVKLPTTKTETPAGDSQIKMSKAYGQAQREQKLVEEARYQTKVARDRYLSAMGKLADYFKEDSLFRQPFADVEYNAGLIFGSPAKHAMDYVYQRNGMTEKRAGQVRLSYLEVDPEAAPYSLIHDAIARGKEVLASQREHRRLSKQAESKMAEVLRPFCQLPNTPEQTPCSVLGKYASTSEPVDPPSFSKEGSLFGNILTGSTVAAVANKVRSPATDQIGGAQTTLSDPEHLNQLRQIEAQTMLSDFLRNDEVLGGHDPEEVLQAYNEVVSLSPHAATQPAVMRPLLRKRLAQGAYEPFEAQQIADIEKSVASTQQLPGSQPSNFKMSEVLRGSNIVD